MQSMSSGSLSPRFRIGGRKRVRELLDRVEVDRDSSRIHGDDVRPITWARRLLAINLGRATVETQRFCNPWLRAQALHY
jgi:hypothetical protein